MRAMSGFRGARVVNQAGMAHAWRSWPAPGSTQGASAIRSEDSRVIRLQVPMYVRSSESDSDL
jgi:hypothetical protein